MKKTTTKKLSLSKETLAYLEGRDLEQAAAGSGIISSDNKACTYTALGPNTTCWC
ncbi:MAG TPA: class I lanthipeptide [Thermoanaerobaculia bacterium]